MGRWGHLGSIRPDTSQTEVRKAMDQGSFPSRLTFSLPAPPPHTLFRNPGAAWSLGPLNPFTCWWTTRTSEVWMWPWQRSTGTTRMRMASCTWPMPSRYLAAWGQQPPRMGATLGAGPAILYNMYPLTNAFTNAGDTDLFLCVQWWSRGQGRPAVISTNRDSEAMPALFAFCARALWWLLRIL